MRGGAKRKIISAGFEFFRVTGLHRAVAPLTRGCGAILMLHHVRPWRARAFAPNRLLEIEPSFLDAALTLLAARGYRFVTLAEAARRITDASPERFAALTFDDGYRDNADYALPVLERHNAPFTLNVTTGFADRSARLWWVELEEAIAALDHVEAEIDGEIVSKPATTPQQKQAAFEALYWRLRAGSEERLLAVIAGLLGKAGLDSREIVDRLCLDWAGIASLAQHPLCTIGCHTLSHPMLAKHDDDLVRRELAGSRAAIEEKTGRRPDHLAYPVGDPGSAGPREFGIARELGFSTAVTTRPGMVFPDHRDHLHALPRLSLNGNFQTLESLDMLLSGVPFAVWNRGRKINVG